MINKLIVFGILLLPLQLIAKDSGIKFFHGTYEQALEKAAQENKLVFVDFITDWCGPCKIMDRDVFSLPDVGQFYNKNFVCVKLDAGSVQYSSLAKELKVRSYPTYLFIEPDSGKIVHRSGSRQNPGDFILTGKQAISSEYNSVKLFERYNRGERGKELMEQYVIYFRNSNKRKELNEAFKEYMNQPGVELTDHTAWSVFDTHISGIDNEYFKEVYLSQDKYIRIYGADVTDKIEREYSLYLQRAAHHCLYGGGQEETNNYHLAVKRANKYSFPNKELVMEQARAIFLLAQNDYDGMHDLVMSVLYDDKVSYELKTRYFKQFIGYAYAVKDDINYLNKMVVYARYFAYNTKDVKDAIPQFKYAEVLEKILLQSDIYKDEFFIQEPASGVKTYSLRAKDLKRKPKK